MLRRIVLVSVSAIALAAGANAADIYRAPDAVSFKDAPVYGPVWTGFYGGVNGGYGWGSGKVTDEEVTPGGAILLEESKSFTPAGGFGGGQIGYNWQRDRIVYGLETDLQGASITGGATASASPGYYAHGSTDLDWFGTVRARAGLTIFDRGLLYATGGFAYGGIQDKLTKADPLASSFSSNTTGTGYVVGGGVEYLVDPRWSLKAEYQYIDLGKDTIAADVAVINKWWGILDRDHGYNTVRVGLNYHILPDYAPLK
jgi:outer membrane immunogenic protein